MIEVKGDYDLYRYYRNKVKSNSGIPKDRKVFSAVANDFYLFIRSKVLDGYDVQLSGGESLGTLGIRGRRFKPTVSEDGVVKGLPISWAKTKKLWDSNSEAKMKRQAVYCFNEHSSGITYSVKWYKRGAILINKNYYSFSTVRRFKRAVSRLIIEENKEYFVDETFNNLNNG